MSAALEVQTDRDYDLIGKRDVLRIRYREVGARLWTRFVVVPDDTQSLDALEDAAPDIAKIHAAWMAEQAEARRLESVEPSGSHHGGSE